MMTGSGGSAYLYSLGRGRGLAQARGARGAGNCLRPHWEDFVGSGGSWKALRSVAVWKVDSYGGMVGNLYLSVT